MSVSGQEAPAALSERWGRRVRADRARAERNQTSELAAVTYEVETRCRRAGSVGLVLTGSTARGRRTRISDLDYHVIGARPDIRNLPQDIDLYGDEPDELVAKLRAGDDFVHWTVRHGCVLFDDGTLEAAAAMIAKAGLWPDVDRKLGQARRTLAFAERMLESGDYDAALEQTRGALSLTARWWLLRHDIFPLARDELSGQLRALRCYALAEGLHRSIHERPPERALTQSITAARVVIESS
jgi:HEPN domain-containing protein